MARAGLVVAAAVALVAMTVAPAGAERAASFNSKISINAYSTAGKVTSGKKACKAGRKVDLIQKGHGALGHTTTNDKGVWKVDATVFNNLKGQIPYRIFARVRPAGKGSFTCRGATSKTNVISGG